MSVVTIAIVVALLLVGLLVFAAYKPATLKVERATSIRAPAETIFPLVDDLHNWVHWQPDDAKDTSMRRNFSSPPDGKGATCEWHSTGRGGAGRMEILESIPYSKATVQVDFAKPFRAHNINEFLLEEAGGDTKVTWQWRGENIYLLKVMSVFVDTDKLMGKHFEASLVNLKWVAEGASPLAASKRSSLADS